MLRGGKLILAKGIKLDRNYKEVLSLSETNMISLLTSNTHLVNSDSNFQFLRDDGTIKTSLSYGTCLQANYIAFQNPDYSSKWFFAFIDKVEYKGENCTIIHYTVDEFTTWFDYWTAKQCFIIRQHATTDSVGANTVPEKIEHGEYVINSSGSNIVDSTFTDYCYIVITTSLIEQMTPTHNYISMGGSVVNGFAYVCSDADDVDSIVKAVDNIPDAKVLFVYCVPFDLIPTAAIISENGLLASWSSPWYKDYNVFNMPTAICGYTPVNKKVLQYPYQFCLMSNGAGSSSILMYEYSGNTNNAIAVRYYGVPVIGGSIVAIPKNYKNHAMDFRSSLVLGKFPVLGWSEDAYINWLSENSVNNTIKWTSTGLTIVGSIGLIAGGAALAGTGNPLGVGMITSGVGGIIEGGSSALEGAKEYYEHSIEPDSYKGNTNAGDILCDIGAITFEYTPKSITREWAEKIDKYFTRFGYAVNGIALPNLSHRQNYNFIQISKDSNIGYPNLHNTLSVPASSMAVINNIFRNGVTVWNNHANLGDYSVSNTITS